MLFLIDDMFDFLELINLSKEDKNYYISAVSAVMGNGAAFDKLKECVNAYKKDKNFDYFSCLSAFKNAAKGTGLNEFTLSAVFIMALFDAMRGYYEKEGIPVEVFKDTIADLKYKTEECKCVYGIVGTFAERWYARFFTLNIFALGRLQFEIKKFDGNYEKSGYKLVNGDIVICVHIPRTGAPLDYFEVKKSYKKASEFFKGYFRGGVTPFLCESWLLFEKHAEMLGKTSNIMKFSADYDVFEYGLYEDYGEVWRLFDRKFEGDLSALPSDSSLRRGYIELIRRGEKTGYGRGVYLYENK